MKLKMFLFLKAQFVKIYTVEIKAFIFVEKADNTYTLDMTTSGFSRCMLAQISDHFTPYLSTTSDAHAVIYFV